MNNKNTVNEFFYAYNLGYWNFICLPNSKKLKLDQRPIYTPDIITFNTMNYPLYLVTIDSNIKF